MDTSIQCYLVRMMVAPDLLGRSCLETYFIAKSDRDAVKDSFRHALAAVETYDIWVVKLEVFDCHLGTLLEGVSQGGIDRILYDSQNLDDSIVHERPGFIQG
jgi:hypothetical protein